jgi:serine protease
MGVLLILSFLACNKGGRYEDNDNDDAQTTGYILSGTIDVADNTAVDLDTNDQGAANAPNDNFGLAQDLPVPVVLGGYVNQPGNGADGNNFEDGDPSDFFRFTGGSGQSILLSFSDENALEIHLYLYDDERRLVDTSQSDGNTQSLTISSAGTYYLEVYAANGAGNYTLTVNLATISTAGAFCGLRLSDDFLPGEAIVEFDAGHATNAFSLSGFLTPSDLGTDYRKGPQLIRFEVGADTLAPARSLNNSHQDTHRDRIDPQDHELLAKWDTLQMVRHIRSLSGVSGADLNYRRYALGLTPDDVYFDKQWHYALIDLPNAWEQTTGSTDIVVAVIDTGVLLDHPDLQGKLVAGYDFIDDETAANDGDGEDDDPDDPGDSLQMNSSFHGTHVAGTIAALSDNASGVAGAGWQTRVMPLRVLGVGGGTSNDLIQAIRYAAGLYNTTDQSPERAADIINLSLGGGQYSAMEQSAISAARNAGVIIVAAAGNSDDESVQYPAGYEGVVSVSAVDGQAERAPYSSYGASVDVAAPGGDTGSDLDGDGYPDGVLSTCGEETADAESPINMVYCYYQGTSMAAPHVSAVAALMKAVDTDMTPDQFDARLIGGQLTRDIGISGRDDAYGFGLIDAYQSILSALENAPTVALFAPSALVFGRTDESLSLAVSKLGADALTIDSLNSGASWLQVVAEEVDDNGFGTYRVLVDRTGLANGIYLADLDVATGSETRTVAVRMQVLTDTTPGVRANHYVVLVDGTSGETVGSAAVVDVSTGAFSMDGVLAGEYYLVAGSDMDNDNYIGDAGEAFGAYLSLDNPVELSIDGNRSGLDLVTVYRMALPGTLPSGSDAGMYSFSKPGLTRQ